MSNKGNRRNDIVERFNREVIFQDHTPLVRLLRFFSGPVGRFQFVRIRNCPENWICVRLRVDVMLLVSQCRKIKARYLSEVVVRMFGMWVKVLIRLVFRPY